MMKIFAVFVQALMCIRFVCEFLFVVDVKTFDITIPAVGCRHNSLCRDIFLPHTILMRFVLPRAADVCDGAVALRWCGALSAERPRIIRIRTPSIKPQEPLRNNNEPSSKCNAMLGKLLFRYKCIRYYSQSVALRSCTKSRALCCLTMRFEIR